MKKLLLLLLIVGCGLIEPDNDKECTEDIVGTWSKFDMECIANDNSELLITLYNNCRVDWITSTELDTLEYHNAQNTVFQGTWSVKKYSNIKDTLYLTFPSNTFDGLELNGEALVTTPYGYSLYSNDTLALNAFDCSEIFLKRIH